MMHLEEVSPVAPTSNVDVFALDEAVEREWAFAKPWLLRRLSPTE